MTFFESPLTRVIFFQVRDAAAKFKILTETACAHFEKKDPFLIVVEDDKAGLFVDELLWKTPPTSFLPHLFSDAPCQDKVVITKTKQNINQAKIAFNLCPTPLLIEGPFSLIYEFEDLSSSHKANLASLRFDAYKAARYRIEARPQQSDNQKFKQ